MSCSILSRWTPALSAAAAVAALTGDAVACSFALQTVEASFPTPGSVGVPTNALLYAAPSTLDPETLRLQRTDDGTLIPIEVRTAGEFGWDIEPTEALEPNTSYQLYYGEEIPTMFTTGAGPADPIADLAAPTDGRLVAVTADVATCGTLGGLCAQLETPEGTSLEIRSGARMLQPIAGGRYDLPYSEPIDASECVTVRVRDALGNRSAPTQFCEVETMMQQVISCAEAFTPGETPNLPSQETSPGGPTLMEAMVPEREEPEPSPGMPGPNAQAPTGMTQVQADPGGMNPTLTDRTTPATPTDGAPHGGDGLVGVEMNAGGCSVVQRRSASAWGSAMLLGLLAMVLRRRRAPVGA